MCKRRQENTSYFLGLKMIELVNNVGLMVEGVKEHEHFKEKKIHKKKFLNDMARHIELRSLSFLLVGHKLFERQCNLFNPLIWDWIPYFPDMEKKTRLGKPLSAMNEQWLKMMTVIMIGPDACYSSGKLKLD